MSNQELGFFQRMKNTVHEAKSWVNGGFTKLVPYIGAGAITGALTLYLFAPNAPLGQTVMIAEVFLATGLTLGYMAGAQEAQ